MLLTLRYSCYSNSGLLTEPTFRRLERKMYKLDVRVDTKESAAIERRRIAEEQRKSRIFNARERTIGVDLKSLESQVEDNREKKEELLRRHEAVATEMNRCDKVAEILQQRQIRDVRQQNVATIEFRQECQRTQDRREFDLNDPDLLKKDIPARVSDEDPRLSVSGLQRFEGEDLEFERRKKLQQQQLDDWTAQQAEDKKRLEREQKEAERLHQLKAIELDQRATELAEAEEMTRKTLNEAMRDYNLALSKEKQHQKQQQKTQEQDDNYTEMSNLIHGDMLTENPGVAQSAFGTHRVVPDRWKGMSPEQVQEIRDTQERQRQEKERLQQEEKRLHLECDRQRVAQARAGLILENQLKKKQQLLDRNLATENQQLKKEQKLQQYRLDQEVYTNPPAPSYFAQFNTSSR